MTTRRSVTLALRMLALALLVVDPPTLSAQTGGSIFNGTDLSGWTVEQAKAEVRDGVIRLDSSDGWVRTDRPWSDSVLRLDVRQTEREGTAGIYLRGWPTFNGSTPNNAYRLQLVDNKTPAGEWRHLEIECVGPTVRVRMGGEVLSTADALENPQGHVALWSQGGAAEFRGIELVPLPLPRGDVPPNTFIAGGRAGIVAPRVINNPKPKYTAEAMRARITGTVSMSAVVLPDGTITNVAVRRSLDPKFGLDREALAVAQQWTFSPGTRDGMPVAVAIMIELEFNLRGILKHPEQLRDPAVRLLICACAP
jgi:TonB family protein